MKMGYLTNILFNMEFSCRYTVNGERFTGLNIRGFSPMNFFMEILSQCLGQQCLLFNYRRKNFCSTLKNRESLAQQIFPHLR